MSNNNNSGIRVNIHENDANEQKDWLIGEDLSIRDIFSSVNSIYNPPIFYVEENPDIISHQLGHGPVPVVNDLNREPSFFDQMRMIGVLANLFGLGGGGLSDDRMMTIGLGVSLDHYTQEKKPNIKLDTSLEGKLATESHTNENCSICVSKFEVEERITELECKHIFHTNCVSEWVKYKSECPVCRGPVKTTDEMDLEESGDENDLVEEEESGDENDLVEEEESVYSNRVNPDSSDISNGYSGFFD